MTRCVSRTKRCN